MSNESIFKTLSLLNYENLNMKITLLMRVGLVVLRKSYWYILPFVIHYDNFYTNDDYMNINFKQINQNYTNRWTGEGWVVICSDGESFKIWGVRNNLKTMNNLLES